MIQKTTKPEVLARVRQLLHHFETGNIQRLHQHEVNPGLPLGSRENYLYFTLPVCINFQRSSPAMWAAALATWHDETTRYVFFPEELAKTPIEKIRKDLLKHKLALQPNKHILIWTTIAETLHLFYNDDPREILRAADNNIAKLLIHLQQTQKERFPYLRGPKLANYWPYILSHYTNVQFKNSQLISIIPDTHVQQASVRLGLVEPGASIAMIELAWKELLAGTGITPAQMHPILWNWSRAHFMPEIEPLPIDIA